MSGWIRRRRGGKIVRSNFRRKDSVRVLNSPDVRFRSEVRKKTIALLSSCCQKERDEVWELKQGASLRTDQPTEFRNSQGIAPVSDHEGSKGTSDPILSDIIYEYRYFFLISCLLVRIYCCNLFILILFANYTILKLLFSCQPLKIYEKKFL